MELQMSISTRWHSCSHEYQETLKYLTMRKYHVALANLQRLVIQRLFELHKMNIAQTGK